ncbi:hypothetical protein PMAYCL1PPCAC_26811, partial [Pristionchus mayeri]
RMISLLRFLDIENQIKRAWSFLRSVFKTKKVRIVLDEDTTFTVDVGCFIDVTAMKKGSLVLRKNLETDLRVRNMGDIRINEKLIILESNASAEELQKAKERHLTSQDEYHETDKKKEKRKFELVNVAKLTVNVNEYIIVNNKKAFLKEHLDSLQKGVKTGRAYHMVKKNEGTIKRTFELQTELDDEDDMVDDLLDYKAHEESPRSDTQQMMMTRFNLTAVSCLWPLIFDVCLLT